MTGIEKVSTARPSIEIEAEALSPNLGDDVAEAVVRKLGIPMRLSPPLCCRELVGRDAHGDREITSRDVLGAVGQAAFELTGSQVRDATMPGE